MVDQVDEQVGQREGFGPDIRHVDIGEDVQAFVERGHRDQRRRAAQVALDAPMGLVFRDELEGTGMSHPAGQRLFDRVLVPFGDIEEGRRTGAPIEIFVAAPDGEIDVARVELDRQRPRAVG